jgi:hypothetical protein
MQEETVNMTIRTSTACIYQILNVVTGETYIGSTLQTPTARWGQHIRALTNGTHTRAIQHAWNNSSITDWSFQVLEAGIPPENRVTREAVWQVQLKPKLNVAKNVNLDAVTQALHMRADGFSLRTIASVLHMSVGWASKVINNYRL